MSHSFLATTVAKRKTRVVDTRNHNVDDDDDDDDNDEDNNKAKRYLLPRALIFPLRFPGKVSLSAVKVSYFHFELCS